MLFFHIKFIKQISIFIPKNYAIYVSDDYSVHIMPNIKEVLLKRDYIAVITDGGVTGDSQWQWFVCNIEIQISRTRTDTGDKTITRIYNIYQKYPQPTQDDTMRMLVNSFISLEIDVFNHFKKLCRTANNDRWPVINAHFCVLTYQLSLHCSVNTL